MLISITWVNKKSNFRRALNLFTPPGFCRQFKVGWSKRLKGTKNVIIEYNEHIWSVFRFDMFVILEKFKIEQNILCQDAYGELWSKFIRIMSKRALLHERWMIRIKNLHCMGSLDHCRYEKKLNETIELMQSFYFLF